MGASVRRRAGRPMALLLVLTLVVPLVKSLAGTRAASADCASDGIGWPARPREVRGVAFIGTALEASDDLPEPGMTSIRFSVDEALDGAVGAIIDVTPWCVSTRFVPGRRYLVSTTDTLPLPGAPTSSPTPGDGHAWYTHPTAVAWRVAEDGSVRLLLYDKEAQAPAPAWLREPTTLREAVRAVLPRGGNRILVHPAPTPAPADPPGVMREILGSGSPDEGSDQRIELSRITLAPGAIIPPTLVAGDWLVRVESGTLTVTLVDGSAIVLGPDGPIGFAAEPPPPTRTMGTGDMLQVRPGAVISVEGRGADPVRLLSAAVLRSDTTLLVPVDPAASPRPRFHGPVMRRIVLTGPGENGDRYRITVADRSARVIGARVPTDRDLRFAAFGHPQDENRHIWLGSIAYLPGEEHELLVRWSGTPCGPVVTVDVAQDLSAISVVDRTGGCDASSMGYAVVLRIRGEVPDPADIEGSWVRRR